MRALVAWLLGVVSLNGCTSAEPGVHTGSAEEAGVRRSSLTALGTPVTCVTLRRTPGIAVTDATLRSTSLDARLGEQPILRVSARDEALLRFDLASIPSATAVTRATLKLYVNGESAEGATEIHRVLAPWSEATVSYRSFQQQFSPLVVSEFNITSRTAQKSVDITPLVAAWVGQRFPNHGMLLSVGDDHHPDCRRRHDEDKDPTIFVSSDASNASKRPALEVCFTSARDYCAAQPCQNDGTCINGESGYSCQCPAGFSGKQCAEQIDDCAGHPCQNGGSCVDQVAAYRCDCLAGFVGAQCQTDIDDCTPSPCQNGGVCTDAVGGFSCACAPGYEGLSCEVLSDNCVTEPCHNGAVCHNGVAGYACECAAGFSGPNCDVNVDDCGPGACSNGATCIDGINGYTCSCAPDWGGARCELNLNSCAQAPCLNGGVCANQAASYTCACPPGYSGANCEVDIDDCAGTPCQNGGSCIDGVAGYACQCQPGFGGTTCERVCASGGPYRGDELCDGSDNDCDGAIDEDFPLKNHPCSEDGSFGTTRKAGACRGTGTLICGASQTGLVCNVTNPGTTAVAEICNGADDDCDGHVDEPYDSDGLAGVRDAVSGPLTVAGRAVVIYQFEASRPNATATTPGYLGQRACSVAGRQPWSMVSYAEAQAACLSAGLRLCVDHRNGSQQLLDSEWGRFCKGPNNLRFPYGNTYVPGACNGSDFDPLAGPPNEDLALATGAASSCRSPDSVFDLSGNLREWVTDPRVVGGQARQTLRGGSFDSYAPSLTCDDDGRAVAGTLRAPNVGFRCCALACPAGQSECSGTCTNLATSNTNCGACGQTCGTGQTCSNGYCCPTGQHACASACVPDSQACL